MKKTLLILLMLIMVLTTSFTAYADTGNEQNIIETEITYEQYIEALAQKHNITIDEAIERDNKENEKYEAKLKKRFPELFSNSSDEQNTLLRASATTASTGTYSYVDISHTQVYDENPNYSASVEASFKIYNYGSFREIVNIMGSVGSRRISGLYNYTWEGTNHWDDPAGGQYPTTSVVISAKGYFQVQVDSSVSVGFSLPGFDLGGSVGGTDTYLSETMSIYYTYRLY